jgi:glycosyltransferase 2 family protein
LPQRPLSPATPPLVSQETITPAPQKHNAALNWFIRLAGTALLLFFLWKLNLDPAKVLQELLGANMWLVAASVLLVFPLIGLKAWRWHIILKDLGLPVSFERAYRLYAFGMAAGSFTPGQAGDFIKAWQLNQAGYSLSTGLVSNILDRLFDIAVLVLLASSGLLLLGSSFLSLLPALMALLVGLIAGLGILSLPAWRDKLVGLALKLILRRKAVSQVEPTAQLKPVRFILVFFLTLAANGLVLFRVWLLALSLGLNLNFLELVAASSLATVAALIPISIGGIGPRDFALNAIMGKIGYSVEKAVSLSTFILLLQLVNLGAGYLIWATRPKAERVKGKV